ncbi:hypothetical protein [Streptomyces violascens]|uniref:hypothetical protein n=1 Tax=Streptomyces violascens TaxID=67381 RepID=UPI0036C249ED
MIGLSLIAGRADAALDAADAALKLLEDSDPAHDEPLLEAHPRRCNALADLDADERLRAAAQAFKSVDRRNPPGFLRASALWGIALIHLQHRDMPADIDTLTKARDIAARCGFTSGAAITDLQHAWYLLADPAEPETDARRALD